MYHKYKALCLSTAIAISLTTNTPMAETIALGQCQKRAFYDYCSTQIVTLMFSASIKATPDQAKAIEARYKTWEASSKNFKDFPKLSDKTSSEITAAAIKEVTESSLNACSPQNLKTYPNDLANLFRRMNNFCK